MEQLMLFAAMPPMIDPVSLLGPETDPERLQDCLGCWDDADALISHLDGLKHDLMDAESVPIRMMGSWERSLIHDIKDTIRVVGMRVRELQ